MPRTSRFEISENRQEIPGMYGIIGMRCRLKTNVKHDTMVCSFKFGLVQNNNRFLSIYVLMSVRQRIGIKSFEIFAFIWSDVRCLLHVTD